ncbi:MAG: bifunctional UDP-N-acetylglucosamine diphosphorylase/glucosamine-1-phosphate N-acetyltransferase GlmU [Pseudomonadota bacterium]
MTQRTAVVILAAGKGTRMASDLPKVLHPLGRAPMLYHSMRAAQMIEAEKTIVVAGHKAEAVRDAALVFDDTAEIAVQKEQLGTGHAVDQARDALKAFNGDVFVLYGDTPFVSADTLIAMAEKRDTGADVVILGFQLAPPHSYGRLVMNGDKLTKIAEAKDATDKELEISFCNSGIVCADRETLFDLITKIGNDNANGEYYLTDIVAIANEKGLTCGAVECSETEALGINSRQELARAEALFQDMKRAEVIESGVTLLAPETVYFAYDTTIGRDVVIEENVVFGPNVTVESGAHIKAFSHLEGAHVSKGASVGPYARLRPGAEIGEGAFVGNFVEVKNAQFAEGAKASHLSYIGDASVGKDANIGAGTITCNYDGVLKHHTEIGERAFIGSNSALVAPVRIGDDAMTGSGSVITKDVPAEALGVGRARQENKAGFATKLRQKLLAMKEKMKKEQG